MNLLRCQCLLLAVVLSGTPLRGQVPMTLSPGTLGQLMVPQAPVDLSSPVTAAAGFDPPVAVPGEKVFYRVTLDTSESSIQWPQRVPFPPELEVTGTTRGQITQNLPGRFRPLTSFLYELRAASPGRFAVPAFSVQTEGRTVEIPAVAFDCVAAKPAGVPPARQLILETSATNVYLGEPFQLRVLLPVPPGGSLEAVREIEFTGEGFMNDKTTMRQTVGMIEHDGQKMPAYVFEQTTTPIGTGERSLRAQGFTAGREFSGPISITGQVIISGGPPKYVLLTSESVSINVRPLPVAGELPGFTGGMGKFSCDPPQLSTNRLRVGVPVELKVRAHGDGNLRTLVAPPPPRVADWQIIPGPNGSLAYTLIPLTDEAKATPAIPFSCFDPASGKYLDLTIAPVPVTVLGENLPLRLPEPEDASPEMSVPKLSDLAAAPGASAGSLKPLQLRGGFIALQLLPVVAFAGLWQWGRRRKYLAAHPEIVRCRQARRDLRRANRRRQQALNTGDAAGYLAQAVAALRVVCAPHYPAHPQALVCGDVLAQLNATDSHGRGGETVRNIFAAADAAFAAAPATTGNWLAMENDLAAVLQKLEARL